MCTGAPVSAARQALHTHAARALQQAGARETGRLAGRETGRSLVSLEEEQRSHRSANHGSSACFQSSVCSWAKILRRMSGGNSRRGILGLAAWGSGVFREL